MKYIRLLKEEPFKLKAAIDWDNIGKGVDSFGDEYQLNKNQDGTINAKCGDYLDNDYSIKEIVTAIDIYDKNGKMISNHKDYK